MNTSNHADPIATLQHNIPTKRAQTTKWRSRPTLALLTRWRPPVLLTARRGGRAHSTSPAPLPPPAYYWCMYIIYHTNCSIVHSPGWLQRTRHGRWIAFPLLELLTINSILALFGPTVARHQFCRPVHCIPRYASCLHCATVNFTYFMLLTYCFFAFVTARYIR
jgi:hypothetical protein